MNRLLSIGAVFFSCVLFLSAQTVEEGRADLSGWDFQADPIIELSGGWEFYWQEYIISGSTLESADAFLSVPGSWNEEVGSSLGYATYRARVRIPEDAPLLGLDVQRTNNANRVYVNGELLGTVGDPGTDREGTTPYYDEVIYPIDPQAEYLDICIQIANYHQHTGGPQGPVRIGTYPALRAEWNTNRGIEMLFIGIVFAIGIYHLVLFKHQPEEMGLLYFFLFTFVAVPLLGFLRSLYPKEASRILNLIALGLSVLNRLIC
ncbi:MAG: hypothetical protein ACLFR1_10940 [Spirochaetia bacterium]